MSSAFREEILLYTWTVFRVRLKKDGLLGALYTMLPILRKTTLSCHTYLMTGASKENFEVVKVSEG